MSRDDLVSYAVELLEDIHNCHVRMNDLEAELEKMRNDRDEALRRYSQERAHVAVLRREQRETERMVVPYGDIDSGYECSATGCYTHIDYPFEQRYCMGCGAKLDWDKYDEYAKSIIAAEAYADWQREERALGVCK